MKSNKKTCFCAKKFGKVWKSLGKARKKLGKARKSSEKARKSLEKVWKRLKNFWKFGISNLSKNYEKMMFNSKFENRVLNAGPYLLQRYGNR